MKKAGSLTLCLLILKDSYSYQRAILAKLVNEILSMGEYNVDK